MRISGKFTFDDHFRFWVIGIVILMKSIERENDQCDVSEIYNLSYCYCDSKVLESIKQENDQCNLSETIHLHFMVS